MPVIQSSATATLLELGAQVVSALTITASMKTTEIRVMYYPKDFGLMDDFYRNKLKWPVRTDFNDPDYRVVLFEPGENIIVELLTRGDQKDENFRFKASLEVEDVVKLWEEYKELAPVAHKLRDNSWGDRSFSVVDPEGNHLTFFTKF